MSVYGANMKLETVLNMLITMQNSADDTTVSKVLGSARLQLENILVKSVPPMISSEIALPTKHQRISAYRNRTGQDATTANAVINNTWRNSESSRNEI